MVSNPLQLSVVLRIEQRNQAGYVSLALDQGAEAFNPETVPRANRQFDKANSRYSRVIDFANSIDGILNKAGGYTQMAVWTVINTHHLLPHMKVSHRSPSLILPTQTLHVRHRPAWLPRGPSLATHDDAPDRADPLH